MKNHFIAEINQKTGLISKNENNDIITREVKITPDNVIFFPQKIDTSK